jgi:hypothetical protein
VRLHILSVPDCPNLASLQQRLAEVLAGRDDVTITTEVIDSADRAVQVGMSGSPSLSCRLYRDETGALTGAPSVAQLRTALDLPVR